MVAHDFDLKFRTRVEYDKDDALWYADCMDLQGCHAIGDSREEALDNLVEVVLDRVAAGLDFVGRADTRKRRRHEMHARVASPDVIEVCA